MRIGGKAVWIVGCLAVAMVGIVVAAESRSLLREVKRGTADSFTWNPLCKNSPYEMVLNVTNTDDRVFKVPSAKWAEDGGGGWKITLENTSNVDFQKPIPNAEPKEDGKPYKPKFRGEFEGKGGGVKGGHGDGAPTWNLEGEYDVLKVDIEPTWDIVAEGDDSEVFKATVTPAGLSGITYAWIWQAITNGGNTPSVTFTAPSAATTQVDRAHWYAVPDARCASNQVSDYRLWCTVSIGGVSCSNYATMSVKLVDPAAETEAEYAFTNGPWIAFNAASNWWYVSGVGTLARQVTLTTNWMLHANSEFTAKIRAHENQHSQDLVNGFDGHEFMTVREFYARISPLTDPTSTGLVSKINQEIALYTADEYTEVFSLKAGFEVRAYNVSDGVGPDYFYSNCGRYTYP